MENMLIKLSPGNESSHREPHSVTSATAACIFPKTKCRKSSLLGMHPHCQHYKGKRTQQLG